MSGGAWAIEYRLDKKGRTRTQGSIRSFKGLIRVSVDTLKDGDWFYQVIGTKVTRKLKFTPELGELYLSEIDRIGVYVENKNYGKKKKSSRKDAKNNSSFKTSLFS